MRHCFAVIVCYVLLKVDRLNARGGAVGEGFGTRAVYDDFIEPFTWGAFGFRVQPADRVRDGIAGENFPAIEREAKPEEEAFVLAVGIVEDGVVVFTLIISFENVENGHRARVFIREFVFLLIGDNVNARPCIYGRAFIDVFQGRAKCGGACRR